jgi:hypothetical protein
MKDSRIGESLWSLWDGLGYTPELNSSIVYYTEGHVDIEHELVRKALASSIQRDGIVYSLFEAYNSIDRGRASCVWAGLANDEIYQEVCNEIGVTDSGAEVLELVPITFVEVPDLV